MRARPDASIESDNPGAPIRILSMTRTKLEVPPERTSEPAAAPRALTLDELDVEILRTMYRGGVDALEGIDPRLSASRIGRSLAVGRSRVAGRMHAWVRSGFMSRYDVWINPALFNHRGAWARVRVDRAGRKPELNRRLGLVEGVVSATEFLGTRVNIGIVAPDSTQIERRLDLIRGLTGVEEALRLADWPTREARRQLTPLEVRVVRALRAQPTATLNDTARRAGISARTLTRKYSDLIESSLVWFQPVFDLRSLSSPLVALSATLDRGSNPHAITGQLRLRYPLLVELAEPGPPPARTYAQFEWGVIVPTAQIDDLTQYASSLKGVERVEWKVPVRTCNYSDWFDSRLEELSVASRRPEHRFSGTPRGRHTAS